jgi:hypothetical protein
LERERERDLTKKGVTKTSTKCLEVWVESSSKHFSLSLDVLKIRGRRWQWENISFLLFGCRAEKRPFPLFGCMWKKE